MVKKVVIPARCAPPAPESSLFNRSCKPYFNLDSRFTMRCPGMTTRGFTLIELLVVVLIIGILSSVALPQYTKAVWKARAAELRSVTRTLATGQEAFFMANGTWPRSFDELDIDVNLPNKGRGSQCGLTTQDSRGNDKYELIVNNNFGQHHLSSSMFIDGPYKCGGFTFVHPGSKGSGISEGKMYCWEQSSRPAGFFCEKVMQGKYAASNWNYRMYELP